MDVSHGLLKLASTCAICVKVEDTTYQSMQTMLILCTTSRVNTAPFPPPLPFQAYKIGATFPAGDGCNNCRCNEDGRATCSQNKCS